jgi:hypothetical protein
MLARLIRKYNIVYFHKSWFRNSVLVQGRQRSTKEYINRQGLPAPLSSYARSHLISSSLSAEINQLSNQPYPLRTLPAPPLNLPCFCTALLLFLGRRRETLNSRHLHASVACKGGEEDPENQTSISEWIYSHQAFSPSGQYDLARVVRLILYFVYKYALSFSQLFSSPSSLSSSTFFTRRNTTFFSFEYHLHRVKPDDILFSPFN